jgi:5-methyltetrahydrofolate--homocysteine methyltransferase
MNVLLYDLTHAGPVLTDGAWGTELQARGLASDEFPDAWNLTHPDRVTAVARAYVEAGSRVILTNTFGANRLRLAGHGLAEQAAEINQRGVELSRVAAQGQAAVFASIGPTGKMLLSGDTTPDELRAVFEEQARALAAAKPDAIVVETMSDLEEAKAALAAAKSTRLPVVVCMVFDSGKDKDRTMMGATPEQVCQELNTAGADVIGANCGVGIEAYVPVCRRLRAATDRPIWIKPNAGLPAVEGGKVVYRTTPAEFAAHVPALVEAGANFIGGCCGTNPDFIRAVQETLQSLRGRT